MERFTQKQLDASVRMLACALNRPLRPWRKVKGQNVSAVGAIVLDACYGGYRVAEIVNTSGGESDMFHGYRMSTRECYYCLRAAIEAVRLAVGEKRFNARLRRLNAA